VPAAAEFHSPKKVFVPALTCCTALWNTVYRLLGYSVLRTGVRDCSKNDQLSNSWRLER
jgi:hypothetical protein